MPFLVSAGVSPQTHQTTTIRRSRAFPRQGQLAVLGLETHATRRSSVAGGHGKQRFSVVAANTSFLTDSVRHRELRIRFYYRRARGVNGPMNKVINTSLHPRSSARPKSDCGGTSWRPSARLKLPANRESVHALGSHGADSLHTHKAERRADTGSPLNC